MYQHIIDQLNSISQSNYIQEVSILNAILDNIEKEYEMYMYCESHHIVMEDDTNVNQQSQNQNADEKKPNIFIRIWNGIVNIFSLIGKAIQAFWNTLTKKTPGEKYLIDMYKRMDSNQLQQAKQLIQDEINRQESSVQQEGAVADVVTGAIDGGMTGGDVGDTLKHGRQVQKDIVAGYTPKQIVKKNAPEIMKTAGVATVGGWLGTLTGAGVKMATAGVLTAALGIPTGGAAAIVVGAVAGAIVDESASRFLKTLSNKIVPPSESKTYYNLPKLEQTITAGESLINDCKHLRMVTFDSNQIAQDQLNRMRDNFIKQNAGNPVGEAMVNRLDSWKNQVQHNSAFNGGDVSRDQSILNDEKNLRIYADCLTFDIDASTPANDSKFNDMMKTLNKEYHLLEDMVVAANSAVMNKQTTFTYNGHEYQLDLRNSAKMMNGVTYDKNQVNNLNIKNKTLMKLMQFGKRCLNYMTDLEFVQEIGKFWGSLYGTITERLAHKAQVERALNARA
jgi:hypothetical protein